MPHEPKKNPDPQPPKADPFSFSGLLEEATKEAERQLREEEEQGEEPPPER